MELTADKIVQKYETNSPTQRDSRVLTSGSVDAPAPPGFS